MALSTFNIETAFEALRIECERLRAENAELRAKLGLLNGYPLLKDERCWFLVVDFDGDDPSELDIALGLQYSGKLGHEGIRFKHLNYANRKLEDLYRSIHTKQINYVVNDANLGRVQVEHPRERR